MSPGLQILVGMVAAFSGAFALCLAVLAELSRDEPVTHYKSAYGSLWLACVSAIAFTVLFFC